MLQTEKLPFVTRNTKNRDSQLSVSIFVTCLNQVYDIHAFIAKEVLVSLSNELKKAAQLFGTLAFFPPQWYPIIFLLCMFSFDIAVRVHEGFARFTELKHSRTKFVSVFISVKQNLHVEIQMQFQWLIVEFTSSVTRKRVFPRDLYLPMLTNSPVLLWKRLQTPNWHVPVQSVSCSGVPYPSV